MRIFKRITTMCFKDGKMSRDPFCNYKLKKVKKDRGYLTKAELERIIDFEPDNKRLEKVRDIFVFCCFTGFDYSTTATLTDKNIAQDDEGMDRNAPGENRNAVENQTTRHSVVDPQKV